VNRAEFDWQYDFVGKREGFEELLGFIVSLSGSELAYRIGECDSSTLRVQASNVIARSDNIEGKLIGSRLWSSGRVLRGQNMSQSIWGASCGIQGSIYW
jgi:hypothetical protein